MSNIAIYFLVLLVLFLLLTSFNFGFYFGLKAASDAYENTLIKPKKDGEK